MNFSRMTEVATTEATGEKLWKMKTWLPQKGTEARWL
jgi:hypothetical protein